MFISGGRGTTGRGTGHTVQYSLCASCSFPISSELPCRMNLMLLVLVDGSSNEMSIMSGRYMHDSGVSSTFPVAWICACSRCVGPPNIIIARASFKMNSCLATISATWRVIWGQPQSVSNVRSSAR